MRHKARNSRYTYWHNGLPVRGGIGQSGPYRPPDPFLDPDAWIGLQEMSNAVGGRGTPWRAVAPRGIRSCHAVRARAGGRVLHSLFSFFVARVVKKIEQLEIE